MAHRNDADDRAAGWLRSPDPTRRHRTTGDERRPRSPRDRGGLDATAGPDRHDDELHHWTDGQLIETYRRLSRDLRRRGFDAATVHRMGRVEAVLRTRAIDPGRIANEVDDRLGDR